MISRSLTCGAIAACVITTLALSGHGASARTGPPALVGSITEMGPNGSTALTAQTMDLAKKFEQLYPGTSVRVTIVPYDQYEQKLALLFASGQAPDIFFATGSILRYVQEGKILPLDHYIASDPTLTNPAKTRTWSYNMVKYDNQHIYATQNGSLCSMQFYYNRDLFAKAHVPVPTDNWTWQDVLSAAKKLTIRQGNFWQSIAVTTKAAVVGLPLGLALSLGLAMLLNQKIRAVSLWRTIYFLPSVVSGAAVAVLWLWILNPVFGIVNSLLRQVGLQPPDWLNNDATALWTLVVVSLWGVGGSIVIYLAGLQGIPTELYDAAKVDGATAWRRFIHVTLPMLSPVIFFNMVLGLIWQFQWFTEPYVMTQGGRDNTTLTFMLYLYRNAFSYFQMGYASAMAWIFFAIVLALTLVLFRSGTMWVYYEGERRR